MTLVSLAPLQFTEDPFPVAFGRGVFAPDFYAELCADWPDISLFHERNGVAVKHTFSMSTDHSAYRQFIERSPAWSRMLSCIQTLEFLRSAGECAETRARLEFSSMRGDGGCIRPHVDTPDKLAALIFPMVAPGVWRDEWGGETSLCVPKDPARRVVNPDDSYLPFDAVETVRTYAFNPNQCLLIVRTPSSWHHVAPIRAPSPEHVRRTVTVVIERA